MYGAIKELTPFNQEREGFEGQGVIISVIDTGIDWAHPMFGGDPTPPRLAVAPEVAAVNTNRKVIYYLPLTDVAANDGFGHGTHVASTAAGYLGTGPRGERLHGMAPQARLMSYKVCSDAGSSVYSLTGVFVTGCPGSNTIMALEDSVSEFSPTGHAKPVAHVINMSLGGAGGPDSPTAVAASNAALAGATVVASAGNSGRPTPTNPTGENTVGAPSAGTHVISVGASTHPRDTFSVDVLQASAVPLTRTGAAARWSLGVDLTRLAPGAHAVYARQRINGRDASPVASAQFTIPDTVEADVTPLVGLETGNARFSAGAASFDLTIRNSAGEAIFTPLSARVAQLSSYTGRVTAANSDNGLTGAGAQWGYTGLTGVDNSLAPAELSGARNLRFNNPNGESFTVTFTVVGHLPRGSATLAAQSSGGTSGAGSAGGTSGDATQSAAPPLGGLTSLVYKVTFNPLLGTARVEVVR